MIRDIDNKSADEITKIADNNKAKIKEINIEINKFERVLRKRLWGWYLLPILGIVIYAMHLTARRQKCVDVMAEINARKYKIAHLELENMQIKNYFENKK